MVKYIGPGPPIQMKRLSQDEDQVVFLLCKQNHALYVLEVHLKDGEKPRTVTKHHLRLQSPAYGNKVLDFLGSNDFFDISDLCELQIDMESQYEDPMGECDYEDDFCNLNSRPMSAESAISFVSSAKDSSRPTSGSSVISSLSTDTEALQNLIWEHEWRIADELSSISLPIPNASRVSIRPSTAISLMRIPSGSRPMVIIPKSRPATAEKWIDGFKSHMLANDLLFEEQSLFQSSSSSKLQSRASSQQFSPGLDCFQTFPPKSPATRNEIQQLWNSSRSSRLSTGKKTAIPQMFSGSVDSILQFNSKSGPSSRISTPKKSIISTRTKTPAQVAITKRERANCAQCSKKLGPAQVYVCKCQQNFCSMHRYSDRHCCSFDYKSVGKTELEKNNPLVKKDKILRL
jgi:hypothetical protein